MKIPFINTFQYSPSGDEDMQNIFPMLAYEDGVAAINWLCKAFGFVENKEMRFIEDGRLTHAELSFNDNVIMLATPSAAYESINKHRQHCEQMDKWLDNPYVVNGLLIYVDDVEAHFKNAKINGAEILSGIEDSFPGKRYRCADLEGQRWMFIERIKSEI